MVVFTYHATTERKRHRRCSIWKRIWRDRQERAIGNTRIFLLKCALSRPTTSGSVRATAATRATSTSSCSILTASRCRSSATGKRSRKSCENIAAAHTGRRRIRCAARTFSSYTRSSTSSASCARSSILTVFSRIATFLRLSTSNDRRQPAYFILVFHCRQEMNRLLL